MKIRIKGNSLRYRLTKSDVVLLTRNGQVTESIHFGSASLQYELVVTKADHLSAAFHDNCITVYFPSSWLNDWVNTEAVGFTQIVDINNTPEGLTLVIEKDFTCLDKVSEDQSDNYPNPLMKETYEHR